MENAPLEFWKWFVSLTKKQTERAIFIVVLTVFYYKWLKAESRADGKDIEVKAKNDQVFQMQEANRQREIACEQRIFNVRVEADIQCKKEIQELHKSYAESAKKFEKRFNKNR